MKNDRFKKAVCFIFFSLFIVLLLNKPSPAEEPVVRLGYLQNDLHHLACFVALEKGLFKDEGVQVEIGGIFKAGPEEMSAFAAGGLDVGYVGEAPATVAVANGVARVRIIAQVNLEGSAIMVRKDSGIKTVNDLKGKIVAVPGYAQVQDCLLRMALQKAGMSLKSVNIMILKPPEMIPSLGSKQIDGFVAWEPYIAKAITQGIGEVLAYSGEIWPQHPCCVVVVSEDFLAKYPDTVRGLLKAHVRANRFIKENPGEAAEIGMKFTGMDLKTVKLAMDDIAYVYDPNIGGELKYVQFLKELGAIKTKDPEALVNRIIDVNPLNQALKDK